MRQVRIGCSGWNYRDWRGDLYPEKVSPRAWLEHYARHFDTVEVNNTFYRLPTREACAAWAEQTPPGFCFAIKASRYLTHVRRLREVGDGMKRLEERIEPLREAGKVGPLLWQFPANFRRDDERLGAALEDLEGGRHAFEFRHESWFCEPVYRLLREAGAALVYGDHPERPFQSPKATTDWRFVRFHYGHRGRGGNYSDSELDTWSRRIAAWRPKTEVWAYFNNDWKGYAPRNARYVKRRLS